jgi:hypothetical protein
MKNNIINLNRLWIQVRKDIIGNHRIILFSFAAIFGFAIVINVIASINNYAVLNRHVNHYLLFLYVGGLIFAGLAFPELRNRNKSIQYFTLPSSTLEKFLSMFLLTTVGYVFVLTILYAVFTFVFDTLGGHLFESRHWHFNPFDFYVGKSLLHFLLWHSIFFLGATIFKKVPLLMTIMWIFVITITIGATLLYIRYLYIEGCDLSAHKGNEFNYHFTIDINSGSLYRLALAPICWLLSFYILTKKEA